MKEDLNINSEIPTFPFNEEGWLGAGKKVPAIRHNDVMFPLRRKGRALAKKYFGGLSISYRNSTAKKQYTCTY